ncbi:hypothetical protein ABZ953_19955 [Streptomyces sp. NPDC046465]|uniref:hypothetical protein n=1 Tax=Streptomyces sp. NPDC046465 TaxID=3155810 RepID=UPI0033F28081
MTSARRLIAAVSLAAGAAALATPVAQASAPVEDTGKLSPLSALDDLSTASMPEEHRAQMPTMANQLQGLNHLNQLNQLRQLTDLAAPVTNALPSIQ